MAILFVKDRVADNVNEGGRKMTVHQRHLVVVVSFIVFVFGKFYPRFLFLFQVLKIVIHLIVKIKIY